MRIAFLGFGLIAGSVARALRSGSPLERPAATPIDSPDGTPMNAPDQTRVHPAGDLTLVAWSPGGHGPRAARDDGVLDAACPTIEEAVDGADLVMLAGPPLACLDLVDRLASLAGGILMDTATVTDVASTKRAIVSRADEHGLHFVGGHPMAGRETTGYGASAADLFVDRPWIVVAGRAARQVDLGRVDWLARACGALPVTMTAPDHDAATAAISHAPLVLASALVEAVAGASASELGVPWPATRALAASGWRDMTRLARGDASMGAGIAATNSDDIARVIRLVRRELDEWLSELEQAGPPGEREAREAKAYERILERLERARRRLAE